MELADRFVSAEHQELHRSSAESADPSSISPLEIRSPRSPRSPRAPRSPGTPRSPSHGKKTPDKGSPVKHAGQLHSGRDGHPKKGGSGGKGTWGGLLDNEGGYYFDHNDPNYDSCCEEFYHISPSKLSADFEGFKKKATVILEEYFTTSDIISTANELRDLGCPSFHYYFVKKLVSMAMDKHDKEKEMAAVLLSSLYAEVINPPQVYKGFFKLVESSDDLCVDIPDAVDVLAVFIARAVVDDILPPAFLAKQMVSMPKDSKGSEVLTRAEKSYLSAPHHAEIILRRWGGSKITVEEVKSKVNNLLIEYIASGDKKEACRCIKDLKVPFFHHDVVKRALILAMERRQAEPLILDLLKAASEEGVINASQITKGFNRLVDSIDDLNLDIPNAKGLLKSLISKASSEGWLCASSLKSLHFQPEKQMEDDTIRLFKTRATSIIKEYFLTGDVIEVVSSLESEDFSSSTSLNAIFIKRLVTLAMDRKNREKEMASILLSSLCFPPDDVVASFHLLIESAADTALDNPAIVEDLAMFLARAVVDEVLAPFHLEEIGNNCEGQETMGTKVLQLSRSLLSARLSGERILRCWGGGGGGKTGWEINDIKVKIGKLLEEYDIGGDLREACRCIKELGMPFFHHEIVKKALVTIMENKNERLWRLLEECYSVGLITPDQMAKGFGRVGECMDDLMLDVPDVQAQYGIYVERAKKEGWLDPSFLSIARPGHLVENGYSS